jgi:hypothetical protein
MMRSVTVEPAATFGRSEVMVVDGVGIVVKYKDKPPTPDDLRKYLIGRKATHCMVEAQSLAEAVKKFYEEWDGAMEGGGQGPESFAIWIDVSRPILQLPKCDNLYLDHRERFICGPETMENGEPTGNGEGGCCVLDGFDPPEECPIEGFYSWLSDFEREYSYGSPFSTFQRVASEENSESKPWPFSPRWKSALKDHRQAEPGKCDRPGCRANTGLVNASYCPKCRARLDSGPPK